MMFQSAIVVLLATTAMALPNNVHKHLHYRHASGGLGRATGTGNGFGNSTGPYGNVTKTVEVSGSPSVVTVTVAPLPVTSGGSTVAPAAPDTTVCGGGSRSTTTVTSTELVTVTVSPSGAASVASSSSSQVAASVTSGAAAASSNSSSSSASSQETSTSESAGAFYQVSSASSAVAGASAIVSSAVAGASSVVSSAVGAASSAVASVLPTSASSTSVQAASTGSQSSSSASSSSTGSVSMSSSKRGLAYNDVSLTDLFSDKDVGWAYAWSAYSGGNIPSGMEFVPQFWGPTKISQDDWTSAVNSALSSGTSHLLSINEPDNAGQANMAASDAAAAHIKYMNPFASKASIGSPAVTNGGAPSGLTYMQSFFDACDSKCSVDFMAIHWYASYYDGVDTDFQSYVTDAIGVASKNGISKVWITEFALTGASNAQQATFLNSVIPWLDQQSAVERYAFFMCSDGLLVSGTSISEDIGAAYLSLTS